MHVCVIGNRQLLLSLVAVGILDIMFHFCYAATKSQVHKSCVVAAFNISSGCRSSKQIFWEKGKKRELSFKPCVRAVQLVDVILPNFLSQETLYSVHVCSCCVLLYFASLVIPRSMGTEIK